MEKKFKYSTIERCNLCKKNIDTGKEKWIVLIDYLEQEKIGIGFYHGDCLNDLIIGKVKFVEDRWKKQAGEMVKGIMGNLRGIKT